MEGRKAAYVYHEGTWRPYLWRHDLLQITCLGDVITGLECETSHDRAASHLYSHPKAPVDIIALHPPSESVWREAIRVCGMRLDE